MIIYHRYLTKLSFDKFADEPLHDYDFGEYMMRTQYGNEPETVIYRPFIINAYESGSLQPRIITAKKFVNDQLSRHNLISTMDDPYEIYASLVIKFYLEHK